MAKPKFKVGDMVYSPRFGGGVVTKVLEYALYPIEVKWTERPASSSLTYYDYFTSDGWLECEQANPQLDIVLDEREKQTEENTTFDVWLNRVRDYLLTQLEKRRANSKEKKKEDTGFKVGDRVYALFHGYGTVIDIRDNHSVYPVVVKWDKSSVHLVEDISTFTEDGYLSVYSDDYSTRIKVVGITVGEEHTQNKEENGSKSNCDVGVVADNSITVEYSPINPSHYRVEGIPEAIDIVEHLMTKEQLKGFLWGNIIKYAYRYGRKGDEHDTAGKIEWYANRLKEACSKEKSD